MGDGHLQHPFAVDTAGKKRIPDRLLYRQTLPRNRRLVDRRRALNHLPIHGNALAGLDQQQITDAQVGDW